MPREFKCGYCDKPVHYVSYTSGSWWSHIHSGRWQCDGSRNDCNTRHYEVEGEGETNAQPDSIHL